MSELGKNGRRHPLPPGQQRAGKNAKWLAIEEYTMNKLHPATKPNHASLQACLDHSEANGLPPIESCASFGKMLALQCRAAGVKHVLELGTLGGYGAIWIASMNPGLKVTTIEYSEKHHAVATENVKRAGLEEQIELLRGSGLDLLPVLADEVAAGKRPEFDFVFLDADKGNNWNYMNLAAPMTKVGSLFYVDNMNTDGHLLDEEWQDFVMIKAAHNVIDNVSKDPRFESVLIQNVSDHLDGYLMAVLVSR